MIIKSIRLEYDNFTDYIKSTGILTIYPDGSRSCYDTTCPTKPVFCHKSTYRGKLKTNNAIGKILKDM